MAVNVNQLLQAGLQHHRAGRLQDAEAAYRKSLELDPGSPSVHMARAHMLKTLGRYLTIYYLTEEHAEIRKAVKEEASVEEVKRLGTRFGIVTPYTAASKIVPKDSLFDSAIKNGVKERRDAEPVQRGVVVEAEDGVGPVAAGQHRAVRLDRDQDLLGVAGAGLVGVQTLQHRVDELAG